MFKSIDFSLHGRDGVGGSDELILYMSERSDGGSLGEGGWGATAPGAETERGSVTRRGHGVSLWFMIMASRHHGVGGGPHTGHYNGLVLASHWVRAVVRAM